MTFIDHTGQKFGRLTALKRGPDHFEPSGLRVVRWECLCDCGKTKLIRGRHLRLGAIRSCGCYRTDELQSRTKEVVTYGGAHARVKRAAGEADLYPCVDCGGPAQDWSYDHEDPDEIYGWLPRHPNSRGNDCYAPYSLKVEHYQPRCKRCHRRLDLASAKTKGESA